MDDKQLRGLLWDTIAHVRERLTYTRVRTLTLDRVIAIQKAAEDLLAVLPQFDDNKLYEQD